MHHNQSGIYTNNLNSHASLLLSASPTIVTSPLQNNSNNSRSSPLTSPAPAIRRQSSAPLLPSDNLDSESNANDISPSNSAPSDGYINFKKPQNEIFKKIDGKIQKIVAAHSNLNKLYALNDFSGLGSGPKRPFELPPQLPPPPPWVPKGVQDNQNEEIEVKKIKLAPSINMDRIRTQDEPSKPGSSRQLKLSNQESRIKSPNLTIDSAISKLHQRRQQQQQQIQRQPSAQSMHGKLQSNQKSFNMSARASNTPDEIHPSCPSKQQLTNINPATLALLTQKIKEVLEKDPSKSRSDTSSEGKQKFQENLINLLKREIAAVAKSGRLKFNVPPRTPPKTMDHKSMLLRSSPKTIFNTIRRETSLLLSQRDGANRSTLSVLPSQSNSVHKNLGHSDLASSQLTFNKLQSTIKVVMPPTEYHPDNIKKADLAVSSKKTTKNNTPELSYQVIRSKIRSFQETNRIIIGKPQTIFDTPTKFYPLLKRNNSPQKSLDKIVNRLQAKCSNSSVDTTDSNQVDRKLSLHEQILNSSASLIRSSQMATPITTPTPIPVFRSPLISPTKNSYLSANAAAALKALRMKSKKNKKTHSLGLRITNYLDREFPQPTQDTITIEEYARGFNLVRTNDVSLQRHKEKLLQAETKWKMPIGNRPLRLRRIRGERIHMPPSASYKAASKVALR